MLNAVRMLSNTDAIADFDQEEQSISATLFNTKANLVLPYTTVDENNHEITYEIGREIMVSVPCGIAKVGNNHIRVKRSDYNISHLN